MISGTIFNATSNDTVENIRTRLQNIVNIGFACLSNPSGSQCTSSGRRKRQSSSDYVVNIIPPIELVIK